MCVIHSDFRGYTCPVKKYLTKDQIFRDIQDEQLFWLIECGQLEEYFSEMIPVHKNIERYFLG